jgi:hypothetical protein
MRMPTMAGTLLLLTASAPPLQAQTDRVTIRGIVVDAGTGAPIAGAAVEIQGTNDRVGTNTDGRFVLSGVRRGALLLVSQLGYATWAMEIDTSAVIRVPLEINPIVMDAVEVVTDRLRDRWRASPVPIRSYSSEQLIATSAGNARDFAHLRAAFGPCPNGRADCVYWRGQWHAPAICVDDIPYGSDMNILIGLPIHELHMIEISRRYIRVYTKHFAERLARGQIRLMPIMPIADRAC